MEHRHATRRDRAHAYASFAFRLLNPPNDRELKQAFFDRLVIASSPVFVPLSEQSMRDARYRDGHWKFGAVDGSITRHVMRCYEHAGFDHRQLRGAEPLVRSLRPDALAAECAFMAFLLAGDDAAVEEATEETGRGAYADAFLDAHLGLWACDAASACEASCSDDYLALIVRACADYVSADRLMRKQVLCDL